MAEHEGSDDRSLRAVAFEHAPAAASVLAVVAGLAALLSAVNAPFQNAAVIGWLERAADESPDLLASIAGVVFMALAVGLRRRLDTAWLVACVLSAAGAVYAFVRHDNPFTAGFNAVFLAGLLATRPAFYRHAALRGLLPTPSAYAAIVGGLTAAAFGAALWAAGRPGFVDAPWWALILDHEYGRGGRMVAAAVAAAALLVLISGLVGRRKPDAPAPQAEAMGRALALLPQAEDAQPEAWLAALGDKSFVFSPCGRAFVMYAPEGGSLIAMGGPVGPRAVWRSALAAFRDHAEALERRPVVYAAAPDLLPDLIDAGFRVEKIGENAVIDLSGFTLAGGARQSLRTARRKLAERERARFAVFDAPDADLLAQARAVSDAWLAKQTGGEKGFSLGRFDEAYLQRFPFAVVRIDGRMIAFATLWITPDRRRASIDLMRYDPQISPGGAMDFLFAELLLWAQAEGMAAFDLSMAPLSGLATGRHAPLFARFGRFVYERGGRFYNFAGLRKFKEKFHPRWEPRYLAAPGAWSLPVVLAEAAILSAGGMRAMLPPRVSAARSSPQED